MIYILLPLLVFIAGIVLAGFNKLYWMDAKIDKLIKDSELNTEALKHEFLISSGWWQNANGLYSNKNSYDYKLDDAFTIASKKL